MNFRLVFRYLGLLLAVLSGILAAIWLWSAGWRMFGNPSSPLVIAEQHAGWSFLICSLVGFLVSGSLWLWTRRSPPQFGRREALLLVGLSWILGAALAALPFLFWSFFSGRGASGHPFGSFIDCYFESMSGLTTTGSTVLSNIEDLPRSILLWRAMTQWLGGLGIVVLFVAVLPTLGVGGKKLFRVEAPGPDPEGVRPQIRETARVLWIIYLGLTLAEILALRIIGGMNWFDSVCHTFTTLSTGGFSTLNASIGGYNTAVQIIVIVFMIAAGVNFALYFALLRRRVTGVYKDSELRFYLFLIFFSTFIIVITLMAAGNPIVLTRVTETGAYEEVPATFGNSLLHGMFGALTAQTTTGYCTADFNQWPFLAKAVMLTLMFAGGCAGSTGGGIKVIRVWVAIRVLISELERVFRPQVVRPLKIGSAALDSDMKLATITYVFGIVALFAVGSVLIMTLEQWLNPAAGIDYTTAATASIATLCNIGPGLGGVGAVENYGWLCAESKIIMCLLMALGRLEVFAIIVFFSPRFWRGD
ncbi:MAG: TrkH family potassium uptake protein [Phycisphaerales bacterium]|nr:MAG: TrkH family potassium uptake protein [Phycisphaerales bacterium]